MTHRSFHVCTCTFCTKIHISIWLIVFCLMGGGCILKWVIIFYTNAFLKFYDFNWRELFHSLIVLLCTIGIFISNYDLSLLTPLVGLADYCPLQFFRSNTILFIMFCLYMNNILPWNCLYWSKYLFAESQLCTSCWSSSVSRCLLRRGSRVLAAVFRQFLITEKISIPTSLWL